MIQKQTVPSGIILDQPYAQGLLSKSIESGHAKITYQSEYITNILKKAKNPLVGQKALEMLLLYDKAYITSGFDNTDIEQLIKLDLLEVIGNSWNQITIDEEFAQRFKGLILADLQRNGTRLSSQSYDELLPDINSMYIGNIAMLADSFGSDLDSIFGDSQGQNASNSNSLVTDMFKDQVDVARKRTKPEFTIATKIQDSHFRIRNLVEISTQRDIPIFSNITKLPKLNFNPVMQKHNPSTSVSLGIYLNETLSIPKIKTVEDILRLRSDSRVKYFRAKIFEWSEKLRSGEIGSEEAIRKEIREANKAIEDIGSYKKIAMWVTFLSVPLTVVDFLIGLPISTLTLTPVGVGLEVLSLSKERQFRWLLFGR